MNTTTTNKERSENNKNTVLVEIAKFGWLTTTHIAKLCFKDAKNMHSATTTAQRTINKLLDQKLLSRKANRAGINCFVLTRTGADKANSILEENGDPAIAGHGFDLSTLNTEQKDRIVEACANFRKNGFTTVSRHELQRKGENDLNLDAVFYKNTSMGVYTICAVIVHNSNRSTLERVNSLTREYNKVLILGDAVATAATTRKAKSKKIIELRSTSDHE